MYGFVLKVAAALSGLTLENPLLMPYVCMAAASQMGGINIRADLDGNGGKGKGKGTLSEASDSTLLSH